MPLKLQFNILANKFICFQFKCVHIRYKVKAKDIFSLAWHKDSLTYLLTFIYTMELACLTWTI